MSNELDQLLEKQKRDCSKKNPDRKKIQENNDNLIKCLKNIFNDRLTITFDNKGK